MTIRKATPSIPSVQIFKHTSRIRSRFGSVPIFPEQEGWDRPLFAARSPLPAAQPSILTGVPW